MRFESPGLTADCEETRAAPTTRDRPVLAAALFAPVRWFRGSSRGSDSPPCFDSELGL